MWSKKLTKGISYEQKIVHTESEQKTQHKKKVLEAFFPLFLQLVNSTRLSLQAPSSFSSIIKKQTPPNFGYERLHPGFVLLLTSSSTDIRYETVSVPQVYNQSAPLVKQRMEQHYPISTMHCKQRYFLWFRPNYNSSRLDQLQDSKKVSDWSLGKSL